ncbi:ArsR family transcriptional regulator [Streptomyces bacillaris]|uniref:ArsR family transcriptional regulator n=1 Tax=Streptomyces bacillaris TaxID=68179 RepID=UPI00365B802D
MVYRIHFTADDLARVRIGDGPMPMAELLQAARLVQRAGHQAQLAAWRRSVLPHLTPQARIALALVPAYGTTPDFMNPVSNGTPEETLEILRATPPQQIATDLASTYMGGYRLPTWAHRLVDDTELRRALFDGWAFLHERLLQPYWAGITDRHASGRAARLRQFMSGGTEALLAQACPGWIQWKPPVLECRTVLETADFDLFLEGRGLHIQPSPLQITSASLSDDGHTQPVLFLPVEGEDIAALTQLTPLPPAHRPTPAVTALLGRTRAAVLESITQHDGTTTTELARRLQISPAAPASTPQSSGKQDSYTPHARATKQYTAPPASERTF